jgi:hypothetical protein
MYLAEASGMCRWKRMCGFADGMDVRMKILCECEDDAEYGAFDF